MSNESALDKDITLSSPDSSFDRSVVPVHAKTSGVSHILRAHWPVLLGGLGIRLVCVALLYGEQLSPDREGFAFGWEVGRVARSMVLGNGFASPLTGDTGPTAWLPPVYTSLLAAVFKILGIYSAQSAIAILTLNSLFSTITIIPLVVIAQEIFDGRVARWAAWGWSLFPLGIFIPVTKIWGEPLDALLMAVVLLMSLRMAGTSSSSYWFSGGMLVGLAALTNPNTMAVIPGLWGWSCLRLKRRGRTWRNPLAIGTLGLVIVIAPWFMRNYAVFGQFLPFRSNFWLEVYIANNSRTPVMLVDWHAHPASSPIEMSEYRRLGELSYMSAKRQQSLSFIRNHPGTFLLLTARRFLFVWTGFWSSDPRYLASEPLQIPLIFFNTAFSILIVMGMAMAWRARRPELFPFVVLVVCQPAVYYLT